MWGIQTVGQLIEALKKFDPDMHVYHLDSFNGGGAARTINFGPVAEKLSGERICGDCEDQKGKKAVVMGHGCY